MSDAEFAWKDLLTDRSWLEAAIEGEGHSANGLIENIDLHGVYVSLSNRHFLPGDQVAIDISVRDLDRRRHPVVTVYARVMHADKKGVHLRFRPMTVSKYAILMEIVDCAPTYEGSDKMRYQQILLKEALSLSHSYE